jgi:DNA adenine methylase
MLAAPFPYFGGKSKAAPLVWSRFGEVDNYVEPFCGSAAMLLSAPEGRRVETINDADGFVANFWRSVANDPDSVAHHADWPVIEADLEARHSWLVQRSDRLRWQLEDPDFYDPKIAGWWVWGVCAWIGAGWCSGTGPHITTGARIFDRRQLPHLSAGQGINRQLPHVGNAGQGINRQLPHVGNAGQGINRQLPHVGNAGRGEFIREWMRQLSDRMRDVRVANGDWKRVLSTSVTTRHGVTAVFLDPPYFKGAMDYAAGGVGSLISQDVAAWCAENGNDPNLRIALCGHGDEHDLSAHGWKSEAWKARGGYARSEDAVANRKSETIWFSPHCVARDRELQEAAE